MTSFERVIRPFFNPAVFIGCHAAILASLVMVTLKSHALIQEFFNGSGKILLQYGVIAFAGLMASGFIHELSHAACCKRYGFRAEKFGILVYFFVPFIFVDTSEIWFGSRRQRMAVSYAGPFSNLLIGCLLSLSGSLIDSPPITLLAIANFLMGIFNLVPLFKSDGYFLIMDAMRLDSLYRKGGKIAIEFLAGLLAGKLRMPDRRDLVIIAISALQAAAVGFVLYSLFLGLRAMLHKASEGTLGFAGALSLAALCVLLVRSTIQFGRYLRHRMHREEGSRKR